jgi:hypothetical protein
MSRHPNRRDINAALAKAQKLWGKTAAVEYRPQLARSEERDLIDTLYAGLPHRPRSLFWTLCRPCVVGVIVMGLFFEVKGEGDTFAEAFERAAKRSGRAA